MRKSPLSGLPWLQLIAGALAAMTSAWVASYLGVAGTVIGAAVGSLVASIASALYARGLDRGTTLITEGGSVVSRARPAEGTDEADEAEESEVAVVVDGELHTVEDPDREFSWRRVLLWAGAALATALVVIGGYELVTDRSFGNADNPSIGRPWQDTRDSTPDEPKDQPSEQSESTTEAPSDGPTTPAPTTPAPTVPPTTAPTPDPAPEPDADPTTQAPLTEGE